jgi:hypothetical protein
MPSTAVPNVLTDPGYLFIAPLASSVPSNTVSGSVFTDAWPVAWLSLGATEEGSQFAYSTSVEPIMVAEYFDPISYRTVERSGSIAFNLADFTLTNYRRAINGGVAALAATSGSGATALGTLEPPEPGDEVRCMIGWESLDATVRLICHQTIQGGEITSAFRRAPDKALIPCTFQLEVPSGGKPWTMYSAGADRLS